MKRILSLFSMRGKRRKKRQDEADKTRSPFPETPSALPSIPEPDRRDAERSVDETDGTAASAGKTNGDPESGNAGPVSRITEFIRNLTVRAEKAFREFAGTGAEAKSAGEWRHVRGPVNLFSAPPESGGSSSVLRSGSAEAPGLSSVPDDSSGDAARSGQDELFSAPAFRAEMRDEDLPFRRSGFADGTEGGGAEPIGDSFRLLLDRAEEMKEILSGLNETAEEIRRELTI